MTIRHRIIFLVVLMFLSISGIGGYAVYQSLGSAHEVKRVTEGVVPSAFASADLVSRLKDVQLETMALAFAPDSTLVRQAQDKLEAKKTALRTALRLQAANASTSVQRGLVIQAADTMQNYFSAIDETSSLKAAGRHELVEANLFGNVVQYQDELEQIVDTLRIEKNRVKDDAIATLNGSLQSTTTTVTIVAATAALLLTVVGILLYRQIVRPLGGMQAMMTQIASSQDFTRRLPVERLDEVGHSIVAFNGMLEKIQERSSQLKQKTDDIHAMLQNMPQGIMTIVHGGVVHHEFSAYLETILETGDIADRKLMEVVFADTDLGADQLAQLDAAIHACIDEDAMNFDFNRHLLVSEVARRLPDGRMKILDLTWSPIVDEAGMVARLMLCVRDVTELRKLAAQANEQKRRLEIIGEIIAVGQEKFHDFIEDACGFLAENEKLIRAHPSYDENAVHALFRNMHTIKGNARTHGLRNLTNVVHEAEQMYEVLRAGEQHKWNQEDLLAELARVREWVDRYAKINEVGLGRKGPGRRGSVERYLMVEKDHIQTTLRMLEAPVSGSLQDLLSMRDEVHKTLRLLGTDSMEEMLGGILETLPDLARELGKEAPAVHISDNGYRVRSQAGALLKNVFMHLLRNCVDHGLETGQARIAQGKPAAGTIEIEAGMDNGMLQITLSDDGCGLALARIRSIAVARGWMDAQDAVADEEIARMIFRPGFSTAEQVTDISGRGVGMDAVRDFLARENGHIELRFTDEKVGAPFRRFKTIVCLPEKFAVDSIAVQVATTARTDEFSPSLHKSPGLVSAD